MRKTIGYKSGKMKLRLILLSLFTLMMASPISILTWQVQNDFDAIVPPPFSSLQKPIVNSLFGFDFGNEQDCFLRSKTSIKIVDCQNTSDVKWQSKPEWKVTEAISADLDRDGRTELVMVVWRPHKTWPIDSFLPSGGRIADFHDRSGSSCHLILVGWDGEKYRELWAGSSLIDPVFSIQAADIDQNGSAELVTLEGKYDNKNTVGHLTVWDWSGFGFRLRARQQGAFSDFGIVSTDNGVLIVSD
jgi:hypothetical protein